MCGCLRVSAKAYYAWAERKGKTDERGALVRVAVQEKFYFHKGRYGAKRLSGEVETRVYEDGWHLLLADTARAAPLADIATWALARADREPPRRAETLEQAVPNLP